MEKIEELAKDIANRMHMMGLYEWQTSSYVENMAVPITTMEKQRLIELVKFELAKK